MRNISRRESANPVARLDRAEPGQRERVDQDRRISRGRIDCGGTSISRPFHEHLSLRLEHFVGLLDPAEHEAAFRILEKVHTRLAKGAFESRVRGKEPS